MSGVRQLRAEHRREIAQLKMQVARPLTNIRGRPSGRCRRQWEGFATPLEMQLGPTVQHVAKNRTQRRKMSQLRGKSSCL